MNRRWGALLAALLAPVLAYGSDATWQGKHLKVLWPDEWPMYRNPAYCYTIRLPDSVSVDTTGFASVSEVDTANVASVRLRMTFSTKDPDTGRDVRPSWDFLITVTPNPEGISKDKWLEPGSNAPVASTGMATIVEILKRRDTRVGGRPAIMKRIEGDGQRRDVYFIPYAGRMYALSYPLVDLDHQKILDTQSQIFATVLGTFHFVDPKRCQPATAGP
jgi:hypothetical protein